LSATINPGIMFHLLPPGTVGCRGLLFPAAFDTRGVWGNVLGRAPTAAGSLQTTPGSRFDLELGVSALTNVASSFGLLYTNAHKLTGTKSLFHRVGAAKLPFTRMPERN